MLDPEIADAFVRMRERESICGFRVSETGWVEIHAHLVLLCPIDPVIEMFRLDLIAIHIFSAELAVECMKVEAMFAGDEGECFIEVRAEFIWRAGFSWIISCHRDPAAESFAVGFKSTNIIALPAVERNRNGREFLHDRICIDAHIGVTLFGGGVSG